MVSDVIESVSKKKTTHLLLRSYINININEINR